MIMEMCVVIRYGLIIRGYLPIVTHFGYLFVFAVLVSIMKDYLSAEDHVLPAQFNLSRNREFVIFLPT